MEKYVHSDTSLDETGLEELIGNTIRNLRKEQRLSIEKLSRISNINHSTIRSLEQGKGSRLGTLIQILKVLNRTDLLDSFKTTSISMSPVEILRGK